MRIIAGEFKGRILKTPSTKFTRPTTSKIKESIFNYLINIIDFNNIKVCDIYSGSGSLGLEALSRGADCVHFVEKNYSVLKILNYNITSLEVQNQIKVFRMDAVKFSSVKQHEQYNLIFADPPFFKNDIYKVVKNILQNDFLKRNGLFIVERSIQTKKEDVKVFDKDPFKKLGDSLIYQFEPW